MVPRGLKDNVLTFRLRHCRFRRGLVGLLVLLSTCAGPGWCPSTTIVWGHDDHAAEEPAPAKIPEAELHRATRSPDRIVLTWAGDPATTQAVSWRTNTEVRRGLAEIAVAEDGPLFYLKAQRWESRIERLATDLGDAHYHAVEFRALTPATTYAYRVGDGTNWSEWIQFRTANDRPAPFTFVYFGDAQNDVRSHWSRVIREAQRDAPKAAFFLHAGDLINRANRDAEWGEWFQAGGFITSMIPCVPTPGNHEYFKGQLAPHWRAQFRLPENGPPELVETTYWFDYQGTRIISLNSNEKQAEQTPWLEAVLRENPCRWTIVTFHHPVYSSAKGRDNGLLRRQWQPLFDKYRVDLVLQGHDHTYSRSSLMAYENLPTGVTTQAEDSGTVYVVSVSGPKMYYLDRRPFMRRAAENTQLYQVITVRDEELDYEARTASGNLYDAFRLKKRPGRPNELDDRIPDRPERRWTDGPGNK